MFDTPLLFLAIYHLIEWIKTTLVLTVVFVGLNLMWFYYILSVIGSIWGLIAIVVTMAARFSEDGTACG